MTDFRLPCNKPLSFLNCKDLQLSKENIHALDLHTLTKWYKFILIFQYNLFGKAFLIFNSFWGIR